MLSEQVERFYASKPLFMPLVQVDVGSRKGESYRREDVSPSPTSSSLSGNKRVNRCDSGESAEKGPVQLADRLSVGKTKGTDRQCEDTALFLPSLCATPSYIELPRVRLGRATLCCRPGSALYCSWVVARVKRLRHKRKQPPKRLRGKARLGYGFG